MIYYSAIDDSEKIEILAHSKAGEFVGIIEAVKHAESGLIEVKRIASRYQTETLLFKALGIHATKVDMSIMSCRGKVRNKRRDIEEEGYWNAMLSKHIDCEPQALPDRFCMADEKPFYNHAYKVVTDPKVDCYLTSYSSETLPSHILDVLDNSRSILDYVVNSPISVHIEDEFPLEPADHNTGEHILTLWDQNKIEEVYTSGKCMFLAIALYEKFGHEIQMHISKYQGNLIIEHAWVSLDDEYSFDVTGLIKKEKEWDGAGKTKRNVSKEQIFSLMTLSSEYDDFTKSEGENAVKDAHRLIDNYLINFYGELETLSVSRSGTSNEKSLDFC